jgi:hypothetical protein
VISDASWRVVRAIAPRMCSVGVPLAQRRVCGASRTFRSASSYPLRIMTSRRVRVPDRYAELIQ